LHTHACPCSFALAAPRRAGGTRAEGCAVAMGQMRWASPCGPLPPETAVEAARFRSGAISKRRDFEAPRDARCCNGGTRARSESLPESSRMTYPRAAACSAPSPKTRACAELLPSSAGRTQGPSRPCSMLRRDRPGRRPGPACTARPHQSRPVPVRPSIPTILIPCRRRPRLNACTARPAPPPHDRVSAPPAAADTAAAAAVEPGGVYMRGRAEAGWKRGWECGEPGSVGI
jgi:hypothetical protein